MSAYVVDKAHIDALVNAGTQLGLISTKEQALDVGRMLWLENHRSVNWRYNEEESAPRYRFRATDVLFDPVAVVKLVHTYAYQSCEHPTWSKSAANTWCTQLVDAALELVPAHAKEIVHVAGTVGMHARYTSSAAYNSFWEVTDLSQIPTRAAS